MVDEVEIVNVKGDEVASEETLLALLETMKKMASSKGFDPDEVNKKTKDLADNLENSVDVVNDNSKAIENNTDAKDDNTSSIKKGTNALNSLGSYIVGSTITGLIGFTKKLITSGETLTDFTSGVPLVGSLIAPITGYVDDTMQSFREMASVGAAFNNSLQDVRMAAAETYMTLDQFTNFVTNNSEDLAKFGGTVTSGVKRLTDLNRALGDQRLDLMNMGFTFEEINQTLVTYSAMTRAGSRSQMFNTQQQATAAAEYAKSLSTLSKLTGEEIDSIQAKTQANMNDVAFQRKLASMSPEERAKVTQAMAEATKIYGDAGAQFFKQQILGMPPLTEETQLLAAAFPELANQIRNLSSIAQDSRVSLEQLGEGSTDRLIEAVKRAAESGEQFDSLLSAAAAGLDGPAAGLASILEGMGIDFNKYIDEQRNINDTALRQDIEAARIESNNRNALTNSVVEFENSIRQTREAIQTSLIDSGIFDLVADSFEYLAGFLGDPAVMEGFRDAIMDVTGFVENFIQNVKTDGLWDAIKDAFSDVFDEIKRFVVGESAGENRERLTSRQTDLTGQSAAIADKLNALTDAAAAGLNTEEIEKVNRQRERLLRDQERVNSRISELETEIASGMENGFKETPSIVGNLITSAFESNPLITTIAGSIAALWTTSAIVNAVSGIKNLIGSTRGRGGPDIDVDRPRDRDTDRDNDRNGRRRMRLPGGIKGAGILGALFGAVELGSVLTDNTLTRDEKIEQGSGAAGGMAGGMAGAAAGAAIGSAVPIVGTIIGGLIGGALGYAGGDMLGTAIGGSITDGDEEISKEQINNQISQLEALQGLSAIDLDQTAIEENLNALRLYAEGMNQIPSIQSAGVFETLRANIVLFLGGDNNPFAPLVAFSNLSLGTNTVTNLEAVRSFAEAMNLIPEMQQPGIFETLKAGIVSFLGGDNDPFAPLVAFSNLTIGGNVAANAESVRLFATAMNQMPEIDAERAGGFFASIRSIFGGETVMPWDQVREFGEVDINVEAVTANAAAMRAFGNALSGFSNFEVSELDIPNRFTNNLATISNINGTGLDTIASGLERLVGITGVRDQLNTINEGLDTAGINTYADAIEELVEKLNDLNDVLSESNDSLFRDNMSAAEVLGNINVSTQGSSDGISQLNTLLSQMLTVLTQSKEIEHKIERNTASLSSDTLTGRVSRIR